MLYVNLELDRASCLHGSKDDGHTTAQGIQPNPASHNIDSLIWNLRGKSVPMDKAGFTKTDTQGRKKRLCGSYKIDPIYRVITQGMKTALTRWRISAATSLRREVCWESFGCAVIYCHHLA